MAMDSFARSVISDDTSNVLDMMEAMFADHGWPVHRESPERLSFIVTGGWCSYHLVLHWWQEHQILYFSSEFDQQVPTPVPAQLLELLALINRRLWLGHFDICHEAGAPIFRHAIPMRGVQEFGPELFEDLLNIAISECERFYPAFQQVFWGGKSAEQALAAALVECAGDA